MSHYDEYPEFKHNGGKMDEVTKWLNKAAEGSFSKIDESSAYAGLVTKNFKTDPLCALQLGYAILNDKPIVLLVDEGVEIPESAVRAAKLIKKINTKDPNWAKDATDTISEFVGRLT